MAIIFEKMRGEFMKLYGIKTCDTCRKALKSLEGAGHSVEFIDVRATPVDRATLAQWFDQFGAAVLNTRSTTWRGLADQDRAGDPIDLLSAHPTLMKRPVIIDGDRATLGWDKAAQAAWI